MKKFMSAAVVAVCMVSVGFAGAFNPKDVPADAKWMMHFDVAKFQVSELGKYIRNNPEAKKHQEHMAAFREMFNFDPQNDLSSVTMYGADERHDQAVIVVQGKLDQPKLTTIMKAAADYSEVQHGSHIIGSFSKQCGAKGNVGSLPMPDVEKGKTVYVSFIDANKVVVGGDIEVVKKAVTVCEGMAVSMDTGAVKSAGDAGGWIYMMGKGELKQMKSVSPNSKCFSQVESAEVVFGEEAGILKGKAVMTAKTPEAAAQIQSLVMGLTALATLNAEANPDAAKMAQSIKASVNGTETVLTMDFPVADMISMIEKAAKKRGEFMKRRAASGKAETAAPEAGNASETL